MKNLLLLAALAVPVTAFAQPSPPVPVNPSLLPQISMDLRPGTQSTLIKHGTIYTVGARGTIANGDVLIVDGKIALVGNNLSAPGAKVIDAKGKPVTPGLMASWTQLGIQEIQLVAETNDSGPNTSLDSAAYDVADAINPASTLIPVARIRGITRSLSAPVDCGDVFCGTAAVIHLGLGNDLIVKRQAGVLAEFEPVGGGNGQANSRPDIWAKFRETMDDAREYCSQRAGYRRPGGYRDQRSYKIDLDALCPVLSGKERLMAHAERASTIRQVLAYAQANHLSLVLFGANEAWMVAKELAAAKVPVVIDNNINLPVQFAYLNATLKNAARLDAAGVVVAFQPQNDDPGQYARTLTQIAGNAVANGMNWDHALAAMTRNPAGVWGIADTYGTLDPGKDADVVIWDGDPLEVTSAPTAVFIKGQQMPMVTRQTLLRDRYRDPGKKKVPPLRYR
jgi:imidazolonepropionase-like amidohydrolase